jgi:hypothetical protein
MARALLAKIIVVSSRGLSRLRIWPFIGLCTRAVSNWFAGTDTHLSNLSAEPNFLIFLIFEIFDFPDSPHCATPQKRSSTRATCTQCDCAGRLEDMVQRVYEMTMPPNSRAEVNIGEELEVVRVDPFFVERQRNQYANRSVAFIVLLNGAAAIVLLAILAKPLPSTEGVKAIADAMIVFSIGAVLGLTSALIAYLNRTLRLDQPGFMTWRRPLRWLAVAAAVSGAACFLVGMNMARIAVLPETSTSSRKESLRSRSPVPQGQHTEPNAAEPEPSVPQTEQEAPKTQPNEPPNLHHSQ